MSRAQPVGCATADPCTNRRGLGWFPMAARSLISAGKDLAGPWLLVAPLRRCRVWTLPDGRLPLSIRSRLLRTRHRLPFGWLLRGAPSRRRPQLKNSQIADSERLFLQSPASYYQEPVPRLSSCHEPFARAASVEGKGGEDSTSVMFSNPPEGHPEHLQPIMKHGDSPAAHTGRGCERQPPVGALRAYPSAPRSSHDRSPFRAASSHGSGQPAH